MSNLRAIQRVPHTPSADQAPHNAGKVPPHAPDAEQAVLSALMLERDAFDQVSDLLPPDPPENAPMGDPHFFADANRYIYWAVCSLHESGEPHDIVTVAEWLRTRELIRRIGGARYLGEIVDKAERVANIRAYAQHVRDSALQRAAIRLLWQRLGEAYGDVGDRQEWRERLACDMELLVERGMRLESTTGKDALASAMADIGDSAENGRPMGLIRTGCRFWDRHAGGLYMGDTATLVAPKKAGKTACGLSLVRSVAEAHKDVDVHIIAMEQDEGELSLRMTQQVGRIDATALRMGQSLPQGFWTEMTAAASHYAKLPISFTCRHKLNSKQIGNAIGIAAGKSKREGRELVVLVDNLHDIDQEEEQRKRPRSEEPERLRMIMWYLRKVFERHNVAGLILAQGNSNGEVFNSPRSGQCVHTLCSLDKIKDHKDGEKERELHWHTQRALPPARGSVYYHGSCWLFTDSDTLEPAW